MCASDWVCVCATGQDVGRNAIFLFFYFFSNDTDACHLLLKRSLQRSSLVFPCFFVFLFFFCFCFFQAILPEANPCQSRGILGHQTPRRLLSALSGTAEKCQALLTSHLAITTLKLTRRDFQKIRKRVCFATNIWRLNSHGAAFFSFFFLFSLHPVYLTAPVFSVHVCMSHRALRVVAVRDKWQRNAKALLEVTSSAEAGGDWETLAGNRRSPPGTSSGSRCAHQWKMLSVLTSLTSTYYSCTTAHN